ncbi:MAG: tRNA (guanosine(37)-N1)-methyltransferase TrmD [Candidatus Sericytochromatia bacterium]|nr:tRNA (guanosine(37)-N1)-methyltransferase TrmD [Candidatus Sericytochromatia bacterium]
MSPTVPRIDVVTLFPGMFQGPFTESLVGKARERSLVDLRVHDMRAHATDRHGTADDRPFGGGPGMVLKPDIVFDAVEALAAPPGTPMIMPCPQGRRFDHSTAVRWASLPRLIFVCGHYEGIDERVREHLVTEDVSLGDYVLTGGELPVMVMVDALLRFVPGVIGHGASPHEDSFADGLLDWPHYTRPASFRGWEVPDILRSGDHGAVGRWRRWQAVLRTWARRPDLLATARLAPEERAWLDHLEARRATPEEALRLLPGGYDGRDVRRPHRSHGTNP